MILLLTAAPIEPLPKSKGVSRISLVVSFCETLFVAVLGVSQVLKQLLHIRLVDGISAKNLETRLRAKFLLASRIERG